MHAYHQIPHWRFERDYLLALARGCGLATYQLRIINAKPGEKPVIVIKTILGNLRRFLGLAIEYRGQMTKKLIPAFEMQFFWGSFMSPFYGIVRTMNSIFVQ